MQNQILLSAQKIKDLYGIHRNTLLKWEAKGLLSPVKTPGGQRRYKKTDIEKLLGLLQEEKISEPKAILYARVSTKKQERYLQNQIERLKSYAEREKWKYEIISEIASGVNENRRGLRKLLNQVKQGKVEKVVIEYPDRLARFGYEYLKFFFEGFGVELIVINGEQHEEDRTKELADDLIAIVTSFAAKVYGSREGRRKD